MGNIRKVEILLLFIFSSVYFGYGQLRPNFKIVGITEGLSNIAIKDIYEDRNGVMWFCTEDGLNRYDSYSMTVYRHTRGDSSTIAESYVNEIIEDQNGHLWIGTRTSGLVKFDPEYEQFTKFIFDPSKSENSISGNKITALTIDNNGILWIGTQYNGLNRYNPVTNQFTNYRHSESVNSLPSDTILDVLVSSKSELWVLTNAGLTSVNQENETFNNVNLEDVPFFFRGNSQFELNEDLNGNIWYGTESGAVKYDPISGQPEILKLSSFGLKEDGADMIYDIIQTEDSTYWIGTEVGLFSYDQSNNKVTVVDIAEGLKALNLKTVNNLFLDKHGLLWIGTQHYGVIKANFRVPNFELYNSSENSPVQIPNSIIRSLIYDNQGKIWVGTVNSELIRIDPKNKTSRTITIKPKNTISGLYQDNDGIIWIGTWGDGLYYLNSSTDTELKKIDINITGDQNNNIVQSILKDSDGNLWIGTELCLLLYNPTTEKFRTFLYDPNDDSGLYNSVQSNSIEVDKYKNVWVGTYNGLFRLIPGDNSRNSFESDYKVVTYDSVLIDNRVTTVHYDLNKPNQLYIGTFSDGIRQIEFSKEHETVKSTLYNNVNGLSSNVVYGIQCDLNDNLWISTNNGISHFDTETKEFANYYESDGLQDNQFFWGAYAKGSKENLLFGGINGFNLIKTTQIKADTTSAPVIFNRLKIYNQQIAVGQKMEGQVILPKQLNYLDKLILKHNQNMFTVEFATPHHVEPEFNKYAYRILGFRDEWIFTDSRKNFVTLTNLDPGEYQLQVKASNYQGIWNESYSSLNIEILSPWWSTTWFRILGALAILAFISAVVRWRLRYLEMTKVKLSMLVNKKTQEIKSQNEEIIEKNESLRSLNLKLENNLIEKQRVIEQLKLTQNQLIESEKMASIGVLTAGLAHELNNPLSYIGGVVEPIKLDLAEIKPSLSKEILEKHKEEFEEIETLLEGMSFGVIKASEIIKNLLEISPKDNHMKNTVFDLNEMIKATVKLIHNARKEIEINTSLEKGQQINANKVELNQVLINIIKNACDAIPPEREGKVEVMSHMENGNVIIEISDNGTGMDEETINQIFEPFFTTKGPGKGTGLGLYISYSVIKKHHGNINVQTFPGVGTKFTLTIPRNLEN